ncbi:MAG: hypothetical protein D6772_02820, partial [Bacteroidetes bacterium]
RNTARYFLKREDSQIKKIHSIVHDTLSELLECNSKKEENRILLSFKQQLTELNAPVPGGLDEISLLWAESILQNTSIHALRQKALATN